MKSVPGDAHLQHGLVFRGKWRLLLVVNRLDHIHTQGAGVDI